jgi:hypothetical protein
MKFKKNDRRTQLCGIAGRLTQLGTFAIPTYKTADGDLSNRDQCILHGRPWITAGGNLVVKAFVVDPDLKDRYKLRTIRLDRIVKTGNVFFYATGRRFLSHRKRQMKARRRNRIAPVATSTVPF